MRHVAVAVLAVVLITSACSAGSAGSSGNGGSDAGPISAIVDPSETAVGSTSLPDAPVSTEPASTEPASTEPASGEEVSDEEIPTIEPVPLTERDLARFIASAEAALIGSTEHGTVLAAPEIYIALAQASCVRFSRGDSLAEVVAAFQIDTATMTDDEAQLVGAVVGAGVEIMCPQHRGMLLP